MSVAPEPPAGLVDLPVFKKPVPTVPTPLEAFDPAYVERRKQITEKILKLKNGRQLAYFTEGTPTDKAVLCLHSLGQSKLEWIMPKPLPGVFLIAVDRQGHGNSSPYPPGLPPSAPARRFADDVDEYVELLDSLNVDKFFVTGSSMGGCWTVAIAAALPERVAGCAPISALTDPWHSSVTTAEQRKALLPEGATGLLAMGDSGCKGSMMRSFMLKMFSTAPKDKSVDPGFGRSYKMYFKYSKANTDKKLGADFAKMDADPYFVSQLIDTHLYGLNCSHGGVVEQIRVFGKQGWGYDPANIKCPAFIYQAALDAETPLGCAEQLKKIIPGAELVLVPECGHSTILMQKAEIVLALVQGKSIAAGGS